MTLQQAIDNAPPWARWLGVDYDGVAQYYYSKPKRIFGWIYIPADAAYCEYGWVFTITDITGPQLIEVNK